MNISKITNKMLISGAEQEELRVALMQGPTLYDLAIEYPNSEQKKANIYKGIIEHIEPSLGAAFVKYSDTDRHGFLPIKSIAPEYFQNINPPDPLNIKNVLKEGQELLVQIEKEERGSKGAALTTFISLAGSYLVLMPNNPRAGGISRRIEGQGRDDLREILSQLPITENMGLIIRTAGVGKSLEELKWDLEALLKLWDSITKATENYKAPCLIYQEGDVLVRSIRDYLRQEISEIVVDTREIYERTKQYVQNVRPDFIDRIQLYQNKIPLFAFYNIEKQIESAYQRVVRLPSGGSIVIDPTEALVSIDVNSSKSTSGGDIEETAFSTNLEAAEEIARQLRLRDIGGLIVIDFIDMTPLRNQREVSDRLRDALKYDRARVQVGNITRFGLLEMSRQRLRPSLNESTRTECPRCNGQGTIRSIESLSTSLLHVIEEEASKENTAEVHVQLPVDLATFLLNEKRECINKIENRQGVRILLLPNPALESPHYSIKCIRKNESSSRNASYKLLATTEAKMPPTQEPRRPKANVEKPAVRHEELLQQTSVQKTHESGEISTKIKQLFGKIFGTDKEKPSQQASNLSRPHTVNSSSSLQTPSTRDDKSARPFRTNSNYNNRRPISNRNKSSMNRNRSSAIPNRQKDSVRGNYNSAASADESGIRRNNSRNITNGNSITTKRRNSNPHPNAEYNAMKYTQALTSAIKTPPPQISQEIPQTEAYTEIENTVRTRNYEHYQASSPEMHVENIKSEVSASLSEHKLNSEKSHEETNA